MDCRTCEPTLIDLVHDELATDAAADARAHLAECASCRASFDRLLAGRALASRLELERPPQQVGARLLQLAEARAAELRAEAAPKPSPTLARALLDFLARFAMGRQVGMATIMLLIVAVGLWSLPRLRRESVAGGTVVDAETEGEAAPSPGVEPADRLDLEVDARARRIRSADGQQVMAPSPQQPVPTMAPAPAEVPEAEPAPDKVATHDEGANDPLGSLDDVDDLFDPKKEGAPTGARSLGEQKGEDALNRAGSGLGGVAADHGRLQAQAVSEGNERRAAADAPQAFPASAPAAPAQELEELSAERIHLPQAAPQQKDKRAEPQTSSTQGVGRGGGQLAPSPSPGPPQDLLQNAYRSRDAEQAQSSARLLEAARSVARSRGCAAAMPSYERVVSAGPGSAHAGTALIEMAQCKRTLGQLAEAQRLLERAAAVPTSRDRARALMEPVRAEPAAAEPAAAPPASPPAAPTYRR